MRMIIIHMESFSMLHMKNFVEIVNQIEKVHLPLNYFEKFYSTSTSTIMTLLDIFFEDFGCFDSIREIDEIEKEKIKVKRLWEQLELSNGEYESFFYPCFWNETDKNILKLIFDNVNIYDNYKQFQNQIENSIKNDENRIVFVYDGSSSLACMNNKECNETSWTNEWIEGFLKVLRNIEFIFECLEKYHKLDETIVVMYGDHGDDFWTHSFNGGFTHCTEPYSNIINVPLIVYHPQKTFHIIKEVFSMKNLNSFIYEMFRGEVELKIYDEKNCGMAFARNMYANQNSIGKPYKKAYSITDGRYILLWKEKIYELYMNAFDVGNNFDLLSLFNIDENDTFSLKETMRDITNSHFKYAMSESRIREIQMEYKKLKKALMEEVKCLENTMEVQYEKL